MRLTIVVLAALGIASTACGKKDKPEPVPATQEATSQPTKEPTKEAQADTAAPAADDAGKMAAADAAAPAADDAAKMAAADGASKMSAADRAAWVGKVLDNYAAGKLDEAFADLGDDVVWHELGNPQTPEIKGKQAVIDYHKKLSTGLSDVTFKAARVIDLGEVVAFQATWSGKHTGKMMDGSEPTGKTAGVEGASVLHFNAEGKVDEVWNAFDSVTMMMQLGMMEGMEAPPVPAMPEMADVVKGAPKEGMVDKYKSMAEKFGAEGIDTWMKDMVTDDFVQKDGFTGKTIEGRDANVEYMKSMFGMMGDAKLSVDKVWSAGDWVVALQSLDFTYKGGMEGVEAKDQKVTVPVIAFVQMEGDKMKSYRDYTNTVGMMAQLGVEMGGAAEKPEEGMVESTGIESCDKYLKTYAACLEALPEAARGPATDAFKKAAGAWKDALAQGGESAKTALDNACKQAWESTKSAMGQMCPNVKWE